MMNEIEWKQELEKMREEDLNLEERIDEYQRNMELNSDSDDDESNA